MNKKSFHFRDLLLLMLLTLSSSTVLAQNLIINPDFATDTSSGWNFTTPGTFTHNGSLDADSNLASGSGELANTSPVPFGTSFAAQCVSGITAGNDYDWGAMMRFDSGNTQTASGRANVVVSFFNGASCSGTSAGGGTANFLSTNTDVWTQMEVLSFTAPAGSVSAQVSLWTVKNENSGTMTVNFDNVAFGLAGLLPVELLKFTVE